MQEKDNIAQLFERLEGSFDIHKAPDGHQKRFLEKLNKHKEQTKKKTINLWKWSSIAAAVALLITLGTTLLVPPVTEEADLASVSPEMEETQSFFTATINTEIQELKHIESPETKKLVEDALATVENLEKEYQQLKKDLVESGNNKRVIHAMITNFQKRIEILQQVSETIETIETLKNNTDETFL